METNETGTTTSHSFMSCVRFSEIEYRRIQKAHLVTGKSIPWLLKTAFFNCAIEKPNLDHDTRQVVRTELARIGNNINQIAKSVNSGLISDLETQFEEVLQRQRCLMSFLKIGFGEKSGANQ